MRVGFMGLGIMGQGMAPNVVAGGFETKVYNRDAAKAQQLLQKGLLAAESPAELAQWADLLLLMVTGPEAVDGLLFGKRGAAAHLGPDTLVVNMSTVPPSYSQELAQRLGDTGGRFVEAPVLGSKKPAEEGALVVLAGGKEADIEAARPVLETMGKKVLPCGPVPAATTMKITVNLLLGVQLAALCETLDFGEKAGLQRDAILDVIMAGPLANAFYGVKEPMLRKKEYPAQFPLKHMLKDIGFAVETAHDKGAGVPMGHTLLQLYRRAVDMGLEDEDFAAVGKAL